MTENVPSDFNILAAELKRLGEEIEAMLPGLVQSRRNWMRTKSAADGAENLRLESAANELGERHTRLYDSLKRVSGLPPEVLEAIDRPHPPSDGIDRRPRESLVRENVDTTGIVDPYIGNRSILSVASRQKVGWKHKLSSRTNSLPSHAVMNVYHWLKDYVLKVNFRLCTAFAK